MIGSTRIWHRSQSISTCRHHVWTPVCPSGLSNITYDGPDNIPMIWECFACVLSSSSSILVRVGSELAQDLLSGTWPSPDWKYSLDMYKVRISKIGVKSTSSRLIPWNNTSTGSSYETDAERFLRLWAVIQSYDPLVRQMRSHYLLWTLGVLPGYAGDCSMCESGQFHDSAAARTVRT
jgi:hypothetical protein